jgi:hypothetical protein
VAADMVGDFQSYPAGGSRLAVRLDTPLHLVVAGFGGSHEKDAAARFKSEFLRQSALAAAGAPGEENAFQTCASINTHFVIPAKAGIQC